MVATRRGGDLTQSSRKNKRSRSDGGKTTEWIPGDLLEDSNEDILTMLSDEVVSELSKSVVSLALSNGDRVLFACSGIAIDRRSWVTRFLTSASLVRGLNDSTMSRGNLKIEVCLEGNEVHIGDVAPFYSDNNFAVVNVMTSLDVHVVPLEHAEEILPYSNVVAVGRHISGKLIAKSVIATGDLSRPEDKKGRIFSKYNCETLEGGPLVHCDGSFVGMNMFLVKDKSFFLPWSKVIKGVNHFWTTQPMLKNRHIFGHKAARSRERPKCDISNCHVDENFGDAYGKGIWMEFSKTAASNISRSVVALASFNGDTKHFACTGFFIEWNGYTPILTSASLVRSSDGGNKIHESMRIEVLLPNKRRVKGTLQHYSLHYNIALVGVDYRARRPADVEPWCHSYSIVGAIGCCFDSGTLMAAEGLLNDWSGTLDCKLLVYSSCKITKAGIGGPLVSLDGKFLGMNFYDKKRGTPFMLWKHIAEVLAYFKEKGTSNIADGGNNFFKVVDTEGDCVRPNRWPVPNPGEDDSGGESDSEFAARYGCPLSRITYINGQRWIYR